MKRNRLWLLTVTLLFMLAQGVVAQKTKSQKPVKKTETQKPAKKTTQKSSATKTKSKTPAAQKTAEKSSAQKSTPEVTSDAGQDEQKVKDMVAFLEYVLNTLGNSTTSSRDKDVLITESYSKIFRDNKVQVEDDLDEAREVITNKDVVAYLKDVDFFFNEVKFEFTIEDIKRSTMTGGQVFYKVSLRRNLTGTTSEGQTINNTMPRYVEINFNPEDQDLKIVSIYTNEFDEKEALTNWWKELSYEWQGIFKKKLNLSDSVRLSDIKNITAIEELDLSNNKFIRNIEPLAQLLSLKLLDLSGTDVNDLTPIRNLTELVELNLSRTKVQDLSSLKYSVKLSRLNISYTTVSDIAVIAKMQELQNLEIRHTPVIDFTSITDLTKLLHLNLSATQLANLAPLANLSQLQELNISTTPVQDLSPLKTLKTLNILTIDSTRIRDITPIASLENLKELHANSTQITDLLPLQKLAHLERIYCDQTLIKRDKADAFVAANPKVLVIFDSKDLKAWWQTLSPEWQNILGATAKVVSTAGGSEPAKEELAKVTNLDSINIGGNRSIHDLEPLRKLQKLRVIIAYNTSIKDLAPLQEHRDIRYLDISDTEVSDLSVTREFKKLKELRADKSKIQNIEALYNIMSLEKLYVDQTIVIDLNAKEFLEKNPKCLVVYKTSHLNRWWRSITGHWIKVFQSQMGADTSTTRENLHKLVEQESLQFKDATVNDLSALSEFVRLKELHFSGTAITTISALENIKSLKSLHATNSPIQKIESLSQFTELEDLDLSNTPVDELRPVSNLKNLKQLNCAGTQIKKLDPLEKLETLESFDCSNTKVTNLNPVFHLPLKTLKCYNTKISGREVEKFKEVNPECNVVYYR